MARQLDDPRELLIDATIALVAENGLAAFSLRTVSAAIGRSTGVVFHHFGGKDGLLAAAAEVALGRDTAFHTVMFEDFDGICSDASITADVVSHYVAARTASADPVIRFWWELTFHTDRWPGAGASRLRHHAMQVDFWQRVLVPLGARTDLAACITDLVSMESIFASVLHREPSYDLLMRETIRQVVGHRGRTPDSVAHRLSLSAPPAAPRISIGEGMAAQLVESAARQISLYGVGALNHRRLTAIAGASSSMIVYHFGNTERFAEQAIWAALLQKLPSTLDYEAAVVGERQDPAKWSTGLLRMLGIGNADAFYVGYARIVGQTCLLARNNPAFVPLVRHLRILEGAGIHHASRTEWPASFELTRAQAAAFAIWIKGFALSEAPVIGEAAARQRLTDVIDILTASL
ncbi:TetR/AcrR family transcriptional regulator [Sphingomonas sp. SORGH_AS_0879]|uniref:TetR/AcrR family transcriptional regulator n=1 Tax=Sphingomonas sp. SORGH_AS_0879 TaxID=3041790 RepID=UPI0027897407|nr:TetR family transcriptional regulator [Sphingomonas sp. SORGH_AS_0879]MDQ1229711.1 AcrR family transcriptional regulator [Sphingomonas sp. SORGH_AS_0879]